MPGADPSQAAVAERGQILNILHGCPRALAAIGAVACKEAQTHNQRKNIECVNNVLEFYAAVILHVSIHEPSIKSINKS